MHFDDFWHHSDRGKVLSFCDRFARGARNMLYFLGIWMLFWAGDAITISAVASTAWERKCTFETGFSDNFVVVARTGRADAVTTMGKLANPLF